MDKIKIGIIGLGGRGYSMLRHTILPIDECEVVALCDVYEDRIERAAEKVREAQGTEPYTSTDFNDLIANGGMDTVYVASSWESHVEASIAALNAGISVACEVGGAYNLEELYELVRAARASSGKFMFMENCCFGKAELLATSMARAGKLGRIVHCAGAYSHDLRQEVAEGNIKRHYRLRNYMLRNTENYPTHDLGPIAKLLNINRGNRMLSLVSVASCSHGIKEYIENTKLYEEDPALKNAEFAQGDIVTTIITCAGGETITLRLDTSLPRFYNREFTVRGTKGMYEQGCNVFFFDGMNGEIDAPKFYKENFDNAKEYEKDYLPRQWSALTPEEIKKGHGGMDYIMFRTFVDCLLEGREMPIDVYDAAAWMSVSVLAAESIEKGGAPVAIPDFTEGKWTIRKGADVLPLPRPEQ